MEIKEMFQGYRVSEFGDLSLLFRQLKLTAKDKSPCVDR